MQDGQGSWFGGATTGDPSNVRHSDAVLDPRHSSERPSSPSSSINFSYPRPMSDAGLGGSEADHTLIYDANSRRMVPRVELLMREQTARQASEKHTKKKKQGVSRGGSHLAKGNVSRIKGAAVRTSSTSAPPEAAQESEDPRMTSKQVHEEEVQPAVKSELLVDNRSMATAKDQESKLELQSESDSGLESDSDAEESIEVVQQRKREVMAPTSENRRPSFPAKRPSVVHEQPELEEEGHGQEQRALPQDQSISVAEETSKTPSPIEITPEDRAVELQVPVQAVVDKPIASVQRTRVHSESPTRTPHFATKTDQLTVRHEPPPRSLSPRKSAMKQRSPTRNASPSEDGSEASSALMGSSTGDDALARRKSVRVSFDDQNTFVVGESAEPSETDVNQLPSPQNKKAWHSIITRNKRDSISLDDNEKMAPRPALPFFGSIREKKARDLEERPLVRPSSLPASPQSADPGQSTDMAIGSLLAQDQSSRNAANISRYREPLPPVVTSVDSSGHISNSSESDSEPENSVMTETSETLETQTTMNGSPPKNQLITGAEAGSDESIPMISISHPSPRVPDENQPESPDAFFDVPGGFPEDGSTLKSDESRTLPLDDIKKASPSTERNTPKSPAAKQLPAISTQRSESVVASPPSPLIHDIQEEDEETSEGDSIYSDAYEDLSDIEGDGFMSLAAIVDSPITTVPQKLPAKTDSRSKEAEVSKDSTLIDSITREALQSPGDWENAKAYWKSLSLEKRRQLEHEAMEEAGEEGDLEEVSPPPKKTKKRKSLDKPKEKPQDNVSTEQSPDPERVYQIQPGTSWPITADVASPAPAEKVSSSGGAKLKKSLRSEQPGPVRSSQPSTMRKSMRSSGAPTASSHDGHLRKSLRAEPTKADAGARTPLGANGSAVEKPKSHRPLSYQPPPATEPVRNPRRNLSADRATSPPATTSTMKPSLRRRGSDSSESSFRRARVGGGEGFGFKKTMRGSVRDSGTFSDSGRGSSRFSLRSLSPAGSNFRNSGAMSPTPMAMSGRMRQSLRSDSSDNGSTNKRPSGFGRSTGKKGKKGPGGSRFADSSDEEDGRPAFRSRFVDSSDEDDVPSPRVKSNGLPRSMRNKTSSSAAAAAMGMSQPPREQEDSSDPSDSSEDEMVQPAPAPALSSAPIPSGAATQSPSSQVSVPPRPGHTRRGSFMSILRRKKDSGGKISRPLSESGARRDTRLERSTEELAVMRNTSNQHSARLHKRGQNWPLGREGQDNDPFEDDESNTYVNEEKRPSTASGATPSLPTSPVKHGFLKRRSTSQGALGGLSNRGGQEAPFTAPDDHVHDAEPDVPDTQRKKKFGALRKMFGLHD